LAEENFGWEKTAIDSWEIAHEMNETVGIECFRGLVGGKIGTKDVPVITLYELFRWSYAATRIVKQQEQPNVPFTLVINKRLAHEIERKKAKKFATPLADKLTVKKKEVFNAIVNQTFIPCKKQKRKQKAYKLEELEEKERQEYFSLPFACERKQKRPNIRKKITENDKVQTNKTVNMMIQREIAMEQMEKDLAQAVDDISISHNSVFYSCNFCQDDPRHHKSNYNCNGELQKMYQDDNLSQTAMYAPISCTFEHQQWLHKRSIHFLLKE